MDRAMDGGALRVLLISRHYLDGTSEGLCAARTAGALASGGHEVVVVAGQGSSENASGQVPGLENVRLLRIAPSMNLEERWWAGSNRTAGRSILHRVVSASLNLRNFTDAEQWSWIRTASDVAEQELGTAGINGCPFDVVFSRLNPVASHQAALRLLRGKRRAAGSPAWCAYFSDPWPHFVYPAPFRFAAGPLSRRRGLSELRKIARRADSLLFPSARLARFMAPWMGGSSTELATLVGEKTFVAPHIGASPELIAASNQPVQAERAERRGQLTIRHAGFLMGERRVDALFSAVERLPEAIRSDLRIEFMGRHGHGPNPVPKGLETTVGFLAPQPSDLALRWLNDADVALLVEPDLEEGIFLPSKLADYASIGRAVLTLSPQRGTVADYLVEGGVRVGPGNVEEIAAGLERLHTHWKSGTLADVALPNRLKEAFSVEVVLPQIETALRAAIARRRSI